MQEQLISPPITQTALLNSECDEVFKIEDINISNMEPGLLKQTQNMRKVPIFKNKSSHITFLTVRINSSLAT